MPKEKTEKVKIEKPEKAEKNSGKYFEAVGRRKTAIARVRLFKGSGNITVNEKESGAYFPSELMRQAIHAPFEKLGEKGYNAVLKIVGGGIKAQAEAGRHGIARALVLINPDYKKQLRAFGFMTRDPRMVERKKYGLKKARRAPQWAKR